MKITNDIKMADQLIKVYWNFDTKRYNKLNENKYYVIYGKWSQDSYVLLRNLFFYLITKENDFDAFYDRFHAPALSDGSKPIAWGPRFLPDMINDLIWQDIPTRQKVKDILDLYKKCVKLEKAHKK